MAQLNSFERLLLDDPLEPGEEEPEPPPPPKPPVSVEPIHTPVEPDSGFGPTLGARQVLEFLADTRGQNRVIRSMIFHPADFANVLRTLGPSELVITAPDSVGSVGILFGIPTFVRTECERGTVLLLDHNPLG